MVDLLGPRAATDRNAAGGARDTIFGRGGSIRGVSCRDVSRPFGDLAAADRLSINSEQNEVFGIIGPNRVGEITLLDCMLRAAAPGRFPIIGVSPNPAGTSRRWRTTTGQAGGLS
jgi:ABC-type transporter Mla maintaining outer membrane lipid asymmetry ATPase subunit MlaF